MHTHSNALHKVQIGEVWLTYLLYALFITALIGILLSIAKSIQYHYLMRKGKDPAAELELLVNHYDWLNRTTLATVILVMIAISTSYYFYGYLVGVGAVVWWAYRLGRGVMALLDHKSPPIAI